MTNKIELGSKVRCKITGYIGIAVARSEFLNGCVQYSVAGRVGKDNKLGIDNDVQIDEESLEVFPVKKKKIVKSDTGGPNKLGFKQKGY